MKQLQRQVQQAIEAFAGRKKQDAAATLEARALDLGFKLADLIGVKQDRKSTRPVGAKYRNPEKPQVS